jgi:hypothetical protein
MTMPGRKAEQVGMLIRNDDGSIAWAPWDRLPEEAVCPKCEQPIRWVLDMLSFTSGFEVQAALAEGLMTS